MEEEKIKAVKCLRELRSLLMDDEDLKVPIHDEKFLIRFVRAKKFDAESAHAAVRGYYKSKLKSPKISQYLYPSHDPVKYSFDTNMVGKLKYAAPGGQPVIYCKNDNWDMERATLDNLLSALTVAVEHILIFSEEAQLNGIIVITDVQDLTLAQAKEFTITRMKAILNLWQGSYPLRLKKLCFVNEPKIFDILYNLFWPFLTEKLKSRVLFCGQNLEKLHSVLPPEILPEEYEGSLSKNDAFDTEFVKEIFQNDGYYRDLLEYGYGKYDSDEEDTYM